ncbi:MAG TPA: MATE family efflux transporter [Planctomycetota bacterium]|jgi:MATE family multidrug resistance protein
MSELKQDSMTLHPAAPAAAGDDASLATASSYWGIISLGAPLALSFTGMMLMHLMDGLFLSWYSEEAIAAAGAAGIAGYTAIAFFQGVASYTSTFVAQYLGARQPRRAGAAAWQGMYIALVAGVLIAVAGSVVATPLFASVKHGARLAVLEARFFEVMCWGAPANLLGAALAGFFAGIGANKPLMLVQLSGIALNAVLSYGMIFGRFGLPQWGSTGAAAGTSLAQAGVTLALLALFFMRKYRDQFATWGNRALDWALCKRLLYYGSFNGMRTTAEVLAWTVFVCFVGRIGERELAITNIVWRINTVAFMPLIGFSIAILTLVGHAQGQHDSDRARTVTWRAAVIAEVWMLSAAVLFLAAPGLLLRPFFDAGQQSPEEIEALVSAGTILLRFVAVYCLLDGINIMIMAALQGAGDVFWTLRVSFVLHVGFAGVLALMDRRHMSLHAFWTAATVFVLSQAVVWLWRFHSGHWRSMRVVEPSVESLQSGSLESRVS